MIRRNGSSSEALRLLAVLAHPDDESLGIGGTLARYASEGVETFLVTATRGERGRSGGTTAVSPAQLGALREAELMAAATTLGISEVQFLDYADGALDQADPREAVERIAGHIRRIKPHVVLTFGPDGAYGHPDHIAISQLTTSAIVAAACSWNDARGLEAQYPAHQVSKLYYMAWRKTKWDAYQAGLKVLKATVDGIDRYASPWPDWAVTTVIDTNEHWSTVWRAVSCHNTQMSVYRNLEHLSAEHHQALWGTQEFYRAFSLVNGGRRLETDLFDGLRTRKIADGELP
jgi:LmbE family N-acetylglucosaminyl deacetylase